MAYLRKQYWAVWLAIGLVVGLMIGGIWPDTPLHAVATDGTENFALATGFVDDGAEAVYLLDFLTGTLRAAVLSNQSRGFQAYYGANVNAVNGWGQTPLDVRNDPKLEKLIRSFGGLSGEELKQQKE